MTSRELSSLQTFLMKFVFPPLWISGFGAGTIAMWLVADGHVRAGPSAPEPKVMFLFVWIVGSALLLWMCAGLKRVRLDRGKLFVSNYLREIAVPLSEIDDVTEFRWVNIHPVTIHLRHATEFGERIMFMPKSRMFALWSSHPVVEELLQEARESRRSVRRD